MADDGLLLRRPQLPVRGHRGVEERVLERTAERLPARGELPGPAGCLVLEQTERVRFGRRAPDARQHVRRHCVRVVLVGQVRELVAGIASFDQQRMELVVALEQSDRSLPPPVGERRRLGRGLALREGDLEDSAGSVGALDPEREPDLATVVRLPEPQTPALGARLDDCGQALEPVAAGGHLPAPAERSRDAESFPGAGLRPDPSLGNPAPHACHRGIIRVPSERVKKAACDHSGRGSD